MNMDVLHGDKMITIEQISAKGLMIFGRHKDGTRYTKRINDFEPYYYDENQNKILAPNSYEIRNMRKNHPKTYEADVLYCQRYIIDKMQIPIPDEPLRINYLDIELGAPTLDTETTPEPISSICCYDNFIERYVLFVWRDDLEQKTEKNATDSIYYFNDERKMMETFVQFIRDTDPDIITGWNVIKFDMKYIVNRMHKLGLDDAKLSPIYKKIRFIEIPFKRYAECILPGRVVFDLEYAYKRIHQSELAFYGLDWVAKQEGFKGKVEVSQKEMWKNIPLMLEYNKHDVELCIQIDHRKNLIGFRNNLRKLVGCTWSGVWFNTSMVDARYLREAKKRNMILESKPDAKEKEKRKKEKEEKGFKGAYVKDIVPGLHEGVFVMDLRALYPSIICQFNMGYDTKMGRNSGEIKIPEAEVSFTNKYESMPATIFKEWFEERAKYKSLRDDAKTAGDKIGEETYDELQFAVKVLNNSFYGYIGFIGSRHYDLFVASAITYMGREIVKLTIKTAEDMGLNVIYGDTDSVFIKVGTQDVTQIKTTVKTFRAKLKKVYEEFVKKYGCEKNNWLEAEFEKVYGKLFYSKAKKKYFGRIIYDGKAAVDPPKTQVTGFEMKRSDYATFTQKMQEEMFNLILDGADQPQILVFINKKKEEARKVHPNDLTIPKPLRKPFESYKSKGAHVRAAMWSNENLGENIQVADKFRFIYGHVAGKQMTDVVAYTKQPPEGLIIHWEKMEDRIINNVVKRTFDALGWSTERESAKLEDWFV